jgi:hypothetical protein
MDTRSRIAMRSLWGMIAAVLALVGFFAKDAGFWLLGAAFAAALCAGAHFMRAKGEVAVFLMGVVLFLWGAAGSVVGGMGGHNTGFDDLSLVLVMAAAFIAFVSAVVTLKQLLKWKDEAV